jgi:branched-chain amino acid transport system ATP-binding protein
MPEGTTTTFNPDRPIALTLENVSKDFGGLRAVDRVNLRVPVGERRAIIGPNGAGKTTVFNLISGELPLTGGHIFLFDHDVTAMPPHRRVGLRLGRTYQITNVFQGLSVEENVLLAAQGLSNTKFAVYRSLPGGGPIREKVTSALQATDLSDKAHLPANKLSYGEQRQLELALALATDPRVLMLDEPAAGLSAVERTRIAALIRSLPKTLTIVLIEHDMDLALGLVDMVTCLHFGKVIAEGTPDSIRANATVQEIYLGAD